MVNLASALKTEIARVARKEVRSEIERLKKASTRQRSAVAHVRREVAALRQEVKRTIRHAAVASGLPDSDEVPRRFSATRLAAHRAKLGLSAAAYGQLVGMSGATIYLWEQGKSRPNPEQLQRLVKVRALNRSAALAQLRQDG